MVLCCTVPKFICRAPLSLALSLLLVVQYAVLELKAWAPPLRKHVFHKVHARCITTISTTNTIPTSTRIHGQRCSHDYPQYLPLSQHKQEARPSTPNVVSSPTTIDDDTTVVGGVSNPVLQQRRRFLNHILSGSLVSGTTTVVFLHPTIVRADEIGTRITQAVTTSEMGKAVRKSVVQGAQIMDQLDGRWEQFSDEWHLGRERSKQEGRPEPIIVPDLLPLNGGLATQCLTKCDEVFCKVLPQINSRTLQSQIQKVTTTVRPSFERSVGVSLSNHNLENGPQFNLASYAHFKAYSDLILEQRVVDFRNFQCTFEQQLGQQLLALFIPDFTETIDAVSETTVTTAINYGRNDKIQMALYDIDRLCRILVQQGLVARIDVSTPSTQDLDEWVQDLSDLTFSVALDGDVTMSSQILLQEQGFRLYPNYARFMIQSILKQRLPTSQVVSAIDYYMDTDYNSDPDKFSVKEVLINISIESK